ncbi:MAG: S8 family serine peptidase [Planctomycetia bacterium]|nr:S8 family serine peptidase [Planctomycetia bacterium]
MTEPAKPAPTAAISAAPLSGGKPPAAPAPATAVDDLISADRLRRLLAEGNGAGVKVAVIDTGVEASHPHLENCVKGCYEVVRRGMNFACQPCAPVDHVGHGTACAGIIHSYARQADIYSVRVIGQNASGTGDQFLAGLAWAIEQKMDVVNLSLGTTQRRFHGTLHDLADRAYFQGTILVAAANNYQQASFPAVFASLIAVDNQSFPDPLAFRYHLGRPIEVEAQGIYVRAPTVGGKYQLWTGTSFACPHISAIVARLRSVLPTVTPFQVKTLLWCLRGNLEEK